MFGIGKPRTQPDRSTLQRMLKDAGVARRPSVALIELEDREPPASAWFMAGFGIFILCFCAVAIAAFPDPADREAAIAGSLIFGPIGIGMILGGVNQKLKWTRLTISGDRVSFDRRSILGRRGFSEALAAYGCILPRAVIQEQDGELSGVAYYAKLIHRTERRRDLVLLVREQGELAMLRDDGEERRHFEDLARKLELPLATLRSDGTLSLRFPDELDRPLRESQALDSPPSSGDPGPCPSKRFKISRQPEAFVASIGHPIYWLPFAGFAGSSIFALQAPGEAGYALPLVLAFFSLFMLAFALTRSRLTLTADAIELCHSIAGFPIQKRALRLAGIEEADIVTNPVSRRRVLRVASDEGTIDWAEGETSEVQEWFRVALLNAIHARGDPLA